MYQFSTNQCPGTLTCSNIGIVTVLPGGFTFTNFNAPYSADCTPSYRFHSVLSTNKDVPIALTTNLTFSLSGTFVINIIGTPSIPNANATVNINGAFDASGNVSGTLEVHVSGNDTNGTHYECDSGAVSFSGKLVTG
jgi:hypothetical protein